MDHTERSLDGLLIPSAVERYVQALMEEGPPLQVDEAIQLDVAIQALREDYSLTEIVQEAIRQLEKAVIEHILDATQGNKAEAARVLRIDYKTLYRKMHKHFGTFADLDVSPEAHRSA